MIRGNTRQCGGRVQAEYNEAARKETKARKKIKIKIVPMILYFAFVLCAGFYFYTRITYGMGGLTPGLQSYSFFVLFVEMLGSINMLFYACWLFARPVNSDVFPPAMENGELPPLRRKYIVRVLVPCYKESLAIIQRTVLAARRADRPAGTRVIIYVCDDGADDSKAQWVRASPQHLPAAMLCAVLCASYRISANVGMVGGGLCYSMS